MFAVLREKLISGDYTAPKAEQHITTVLTGHNEITESIFNNIVETMGGKESGWDIDKVKDTVDQMTHGEIPEGDFKESFQSAVVHAIEQAPGGAAMIGAIEARSRLGGEVNEERVEHLAAGQLNGMINAYEENLAAQQPAQTEPSVEQSNPIFEGGMKL